MALTSSQSRQSDLGLVESRSFTVQNFELSNGGVLPEMTLAYETYGTLRADGRNAILINHGYTSSQHAAGHNARGEAGWWDRLIGPGKTIDTTRYFVVCSNMLGSAYGSTGPRSLNPATGKPYGPDFPAINLMDMVRAQHRLLRALGVKHLVMVAGPSFGGYQAFQWAATYPDEMDVVVAVVTAPRVRNGAQMVEELSARFAAASGWNDGWYYNTGGLEDFMTEFRVTTLKRYGIEAELMTGYPEPAAREAALRRLAETWAREFDANSLIALARARSDFDTEKDFSRIRAKLLYVLSRTDILFPPSLAPEVMAKLKAAGVDATYFELDSEKGHLASGLDWQKWAPVLRNFLDQLGTL
jgi:homoserine O-acetyltransferase/O-succinyltransferase